jgi:hypothetical protein
MYKFTKETLQNYIQTITTNFYHRNTINIKYTHENAYVPSRIVLNLFSCFTKKVTWKTIPIFAPE